MGGTGVGPCPMVEFGINDVGTHVILPYNVLQHNFKYFLEIKNIFCPNHVAMGLSSPRALCT
jgi:hypothetical protein